ncbi:hypothetical protein K0M31_001160, partial [Melipona bicolor]
MKILHYQQPIETNSEEAKNLICPNIGSRAQNRQCCTAKNDHPQSLPLRHRDRFM